MAARGYGSTIVIEPVLLPRMTLGPFFSNAPITQTYRLVNRGRRYQQLVWSCEQFPSYLRYKPARNTGAEGGASTAQQEGPVFKLNPLRFNMEPGDVREMSVSCFVDTYAQSIVEVLCTRTY